MDRLLPSSFYPDYFKSDLRIGSGAETHPLALALDDTVAGAALLCFLDSLRIQPNFFTEQEQRDTLTAQGFAHSCLSAKLVNALFSIRQELFSQRFTLPAVERLAQLYFGPCEVMRGYPYRSRRMEGDLSSRVRLVDPESVNNVLFVRLTQPCSTAKVKEFIKNAKQLIPEGFSIQIAQAPQPATPVRPMRLETQFHMIQRRL